MNHHPIRPACSYGFADSYLRSGLLSLSEKTIRLISRIISSYDGFFSVFSYACA